MYVNILIKLFLVFFIFIKFYKIENENNNLEIKNLKIQKIYKHQALNQILILIKKQLKRNIVLTKDKNLLINLLINISSSNEHLKSKVDKDDKKKSKKSQMIKKKK